MWWSEWECGLTRQVELSGRCVSHCIWCKSNSISEMGHHTNSDIWWCWCDALRLFCCLRTWRLAVVNANMNSANYQNILKENVRLSVCDLELKHIWVLQQDNDPKHTSRSTSEWVKKHKMKTLEWPSQSQDLNLIEILWHDLKKVFHPRKLFCVTDYKNCAKRSEPKLPDRTATDCQLSQTLDCSCWC